LASSFLDPLLKRPQDRWGLRNDRTNLTVASSLECAFESATRRKGLLGRTSMPAGAGLIIAPCNSIHTFFMRFAIDVAFVSRDGLVVRVSRVVPAWRIRLALRGFAVVELAAGALERSDTRAGDRLSLAQP
jgi:uncharacterized protein